MNQAGQQNYEILIVDDSLPTARALAELLIRNGFEVAVYTNGADALAYLEVGRPAAAVVDIHLPDISGLVISKHIRQQHGPNLPIIVISGDSSMANINSLQMVGVTHFYSKPVKASDLLRRLDELVRQQAAS
jgi:CheY-like chemotaxis protein